MKEKDQRNYRKFSRQFILTVLLDYYSSGSSKRSIVRKYGLSGGLLYGWLRKYESESLSLPTDMSELESKVYMAQKKHKSERAAAVRPSTEEERLREEIARLRKALAYSELRNEALNEIIKISKEKYGIDLLKKGWRQAVDNLRARHPGASIGCLSGLFGKTREGYYSVSREKRAARELTESEIVGTVGEAPQPGSRHRRLQSLFLILKGVYGGGCVAATLSTASCTSGLMLKPCRRRHTTNSNHPWRKYPNLVKGFRPEGMNRLWVADITYVDTDEGVAYLHLLTDAFTHEIIGWRLSDSLKASNTVAALRQAIDTVGRFGMDGLIHHSDRGSQYCSSEYTGLLRSAGVRISMTEDYNPTDNAVAERVNGIIKQEWLYRMKRPASVGEAERTISRIIRFYNDVRT